MELLLVLAKAAGGLVLLYLGGEGLVRGAAGLAVRLGVQPLTVGLTVVAFGTSMPELVVTLDAATRKVNDIAVGNVVGSNICNITLVMGLAALVRPLEVHRQIVRMDGPVMLAAFVLLILFLLDNRVARAEALILFAGIILYTAFNLWQARREPIVVQKEVMESVPRDAWPAPVEAGILLAGLGGLVLGGDLLVTAAVDMTRALGVTEAVIGLTVVALGTNLPEIAATVIASLRRHGDIAAGNAIGSNIFNVFSVLGLTALVHPLVRGGVSWLDLGLMTGLALVFQVLLMTRLRLARAEGLVLVSLYAAYIGWQFSGGG